MKRRFGAPCDLAISANPATYTARQPPVPIVGTRRSFQSPTMTPFLSEKKLTTSPEPVRGRLLSPRVSAPRRACPRPEREQAGSRGAGAGGAGETAGRRAAGKADPPQRLCPRPVPRRPPSGSGVHVCPAAGRAGGPRAREEAKPSPLRPGPPTAAEGRRSVECAAARLGG